MRTACFLAEREHDAREDPEHEEHASGAHGAIAKCEVEAHERESARGMRALGW